MSHSVSPCISVSLGVGSWESGVDVSFHTRYGLISRQQFSAT